MIKNRKKPSIIVAAFIKYKDKILLGYSPMFKVWRVPGGRVEFGEKLEKTLKREMKEELSVTIKNPLFLGYGEDSQYNFTFRRTTSRLIMYFFVIINKLPKVDKIEFSEYKWLSIDEIKNHKNTESALTNFFKKYPKLKL